MLAITFDVTQDLVTDRTHKRIMRDVHRAMGTRLARDILPTKFTQEGARKYGYEPRSKKYLERKRRRGRGNAPLVFSGALRRKVLREYKVTATATRGRVYVRAPFPLQVERRRELESIVDEDRRELIAFAEAEYARLAALPTNRRRRRKRVGAKA